MRRVRDLERVHRRAHDLRSLGELQTANDGKIKRGLRRVAHDAFKVNACLQELGHAFRYIRIAECRLLTKLHRLLPHSLHDARRVFASGNKGLDT